MKEIPNLQEILINTFTLLIDQFVSFIPRLIIAIILLVVGYFIAKLIANLVKKILEKVGVDKIGEKLNEISIVKQMNTDIKISAIVSQLLFFFIFLVFVTTATEALGVPALVSMVVSLAELIPKLIVSGIILIIGLLIAELLKNTVVTLCKSFNVPSGKLIGSVVFFFFFIIMVISSLGQAGINTELLESSFNLLIGGIIFAFAAGYGLASRDIVSNIIASFYSKSRYKEGQTIQVNGVKGEIIALDSTSVTLKTNETVVVLPMQMLQNQQVEIF